MANTPVVVLDDTLTDIADAIRGKNGSQDTYKPGEMAAAITDIPSGGGVGIPLEVKQTGEIGRQAESFVFRFPANATRIVFKSSSGDYGLPYAFYLCRGITAVDMSSITEIIGLDSMQYCFASCPNLVSVDMSGLDTINGGNACGYMFKSCSSLSEIDFSSLRYVTSYNALAYMFQDCGALKALSFPSLDASISSNSAFYMMLSGVSGCTVHLPASQQSVMEGWSNVTNGFGGTNTTVLFDL